MAKLSKDFNYKINEYLNNPYKYTLSNLCLDFDLTIEQIDKVICENQYLNSKYQNILNSQKVTAEELNELLINSIPPDFINKDDYNNAKLNPAFNLAFGFFFKDEKTVDYYKLKYGMRISENELIDKMKSYLSKSSDMIEALRKHKLKIEWRNKDNYLDYEF